MMHAATLEEVKACVLALSEEEQDHAGLILHSLSSLSQCMPENHHLKQTLDIDNRNNNHVLKAMLNRLMRGDFDKRGTKCDGIRVKFCGHSAAVVELLRRGLIDKSVRCFFIYWIEEFVKIIDSGCEPLARPVKFREGSEISRVFNPQDWPYGIVKVRFNHLKFVGEWDKKVFRVHYLLGRKLQVDAGLLNASQSPFL